MHPLSGSVGERILLSKRNDASSTLLMVNQLIKVLAV